MFILVKILIGWNMLYAATTDFYLGHTRGIEHLLLNSANDHVDVLAGTPFAGGVAGWMNFAKDAKLVFTPDAGTQNLLQLFSRNVSSGELTPLKSFNFAAAVVNLALTKIGPDFHFFAASYDNGSLTHGKISSDLSQFENLQKIDYPPGAHTHSSTYDPGRHLLYVANLGLSSISIYRFSSRNLQFVTALTVAHARTLVYDAVFDKLFVVTESYDGPSYIRSYAIVPSGTSYELSDTGSLAIPLRGGELRIDHQQLIAYATAREKGKESIWGMPLTASGQRDASRMALNIPVSIGVPRLLEMSRDGRYAMTATDLGDGASQRVNIFKLNFDSAKKFTGATKIFDQELGDKSFLSSLAVTRD